MEIRIIEPPLNGKIVKLEIFSFLDKANLLQNKEKINFCGI